HFVRTYVSMVPRAQGWVGSKWTATYFQSLRLPPAIDGDTFPTDERPDSVMLNRPEGGWFQFDWRTDGYYAESNIPGRLERVVSGGNTTGWTYTTTRDEVERYDAQGHLLSISNRAGVTHTLTYDPLMRPTRVADSFGRALEFGYDADTGYLATLTDPMRRVTRFSHDDDGNLIQVEYADGKSRRYHYEDVANRYNLTGITDERGIRSSSWTYDHVGRASSSVRAGGLETYTFRYEKDRTIVTDPLGTERTYEFARLFDRSYLKSVTASCAACSGGGIAETTYDSRGLVASRKDFEGNLTTYGRGDPRGLITSFTQASGTPFARTFATTWEANAYLPRVTSEPIQGGARTTTFAHDPEGNLRSRTVVAGGQTRVWTLTHDANGQVLTEDGPRTDVADVVTYTYDAATGNRATMTDAAGNERRFTRYDDSGRLLEVIDANGLVTEYRYDARGRRTHVIDKKNAADAGETLHFGLGADGRLERLTFADSSFVDFGYDDARRLTDITDSAGNTTHYTLDGTANIVQEETKDPVGTLARTLHRVVDRVGRIEREYGAVAAEATTYLYDGNGNEKQSTAPLDRVTTTTYDKLNRVADVAVLAPADPAHATYNVRYDPADNITSVTDPRGVQTTYEFTGFDELRRLVSPDSGTLTQTFDVAGNLATRTDSRQQRAVNRYDAANRLIESRYGAAHATDPADLASVEETQTYVYDVAAGGEGAKGRLATVTDAAGTHGNVYDKYGRVVEWSQRLGNGSAALTRTLSQRYDAGGRLSERTLPSGAVVGYAYGADGRVNTIRVNGVVVVKDVEYFPFGPPKSWTLGDAPGAPRYRRTFDADGRIISYALAGPTHELRYDAGGRIDRLLGTNTPGSGTPANAAAANWTFAYDGQDRLEGASNAATQGPLANVALAWRHDATGNRVGQTRTGAPPATFTIAPNSNRLAAVNGTPRTYDDAGNTASDGSYRYSYTARNRLSVTRLQGTGTVLARYSHNYRGERVCKAVGDSSCPVGPGGNQPSDSGSGSFMQFVHDEQGRLYGEYAADGALMSEHVLLDGVPVAVIRQAAAAASHGGVAAGAASFFWIEPDHLGTPRTIVNATGQTVWRWESTPYGDSAPDQRPGAFTDFVYNLRFPGQSFDVETQTNYNYFRDYESGSGRYLQSDPLGVAGGAATYSYVLNSPLDGIDPFGLKKVGVSKDARNQLDAGCGCSPSNPVKIRVPNRPKWKEAIDHAVDVDGAITPPRPIDRPNADSRRDSRLAGCACAPGMDNDEWPPAFMDPNGKKPSIRSIPLKPNRGLGGFMGRACSLLPDGTWVQYIFEGR
ncbi:MAG TPA: RHS repeat-associated core domain-containing protein, partial [Tahibacter sp.]|nr:RHS repeat-associated core domain-containing protein [Tahibacter sp.]